VCYLFSTFNKQGCKPGQELLAKKWKTTVAEKKAAGKKVVGKKAAAVRKKVAVKGKTAPKVTKKGRNAETTPEAEAKSETKDDNDNDHNTEGEGKGSCILISYLFY
jgi:hypothetical protein